MERENKKKKELYRWVTWVCLPASIVADPILNQPNINTSSSLCWWACSWGEWSLVRNHSTKLCNVFLSQWMISNQMTFPTTLTRARWRGREIDTVFYMIMPCIILPEGCPYIRKFQTRCFLSWAMWCNLESTFYTLVSCAPHFP